MRHSSDTFVILNYSRTGGRPCINQNSDEDTCITVMFLCIDIEEENKGHPIQTE